MYTQYYDLHLEWRLRVIVALELIDSLSDSQTTHPEITRIKEINFETGKNLSDSDDHDDNDVADFPAVFLLFGYET